MSKDIRESVIAGTWYPGNPSTLKSNIESFFGRVEHQHITGRIIGVVAPHAGYIYSGQIAAYSYKPIIGAAIDTVIVIGPSHHAYFHGVSVYNKGGYKTPLGVVPVDISLANRIIGHSEIISCIDAAHSQEHSIEIQLPFLQVALEKSRFVPLIMGDQSWQTCNILAESIYSAAEGKNILVVASSDLSHFHSYDEAVKLDHVALSHVMEMDAQGLLKDLEKNACEACGGGPMCVMMMVAQKLGANKAELLQYANSGDVTGDKTSVVGYASAIFYRDSD